MHLLAADSARSQIVELGDPALKPLGWESLVKPPLPAHENVVVYELHVRDFSWYDPVVTASAWDGGTYTFSVPARTTAVFVAKRAVADQIGLVTDDIAALVDDGVLNTGQGNALTVKLVNALDKFAKGQTNAAANQLEAFINQVEDFVAEGVLTPAQGAALIAAVGHIIDCMTA